LRYKSPLKVAPQSGGGGQNVAGGGHNVAPFRVGKLARLNTCDPPTPPRKSGKSPCNQVGLSSLFRPGTPVASLVGRRRPRLAPTPRTRNRTCLPNANPSSNRPVAGPSGGEGNAPLSTSGGLSPRPTHGLAFLLTRNNPSAKQPRAAKPMPLWVPNQRGYCNGIALATPACCRTKVVSLSQSGGYDNVQAF